jgi:hypothetical protein
MEHLLQMTPMDMAEPSPQVEMVVVVPVVLQVQFCLAEQVLRQTAVEAEVGILAAVVVDLILLIQAAVAAARPTLPSFQEYRVQMELSIHRPGRRCQDMFRAWLRVQSEMDSVATVL